MNYGMDGMSSWSLEEDHIALLKKLLTMQRTILWHQQHRPRNEDIKTAEFLLSLIILKVTQHTAYWSSRSIFFQNELMVEIYSKGLVRAIAKVLLMNLS